MCLKKEIPYIVHFCILGLVRVSSSLIHHVGDPVRLENLARLESKHDTRSIPGYYVFYLRPAAALVHIYPCKHTYTRRAPKLLKTEVD